MINKLSTAGSGKRVLKLLWKGAKTAADKANRLKSFESSKALQNKIFSKAGMTGAAKIAPMLGITVVAGAGLAGAAAIKKAKNNFDKEVGKRHDSKSNKRHEELIAAIKKQRK